MASYLRGKRGKFEIDGTALRVVSWSGRVERAEHDASRYEDSGYTRIQLRERSCTIEFEAVWVSTEDLLGDFFNLANLEEEDSQDEGWEVENVELYPDNELRSNLYLEMPVATLTGCTIEASVTDAVKLKGTLKNQGYFKWNGP